MSTQQTVTIERLAFEGDGIAHLESGKTIFVPQSCPGDTHLIEITDEKDSFARGVSLELIEASSDRVSPVCHAATSDGTHCGGCPWQHIGYSTQLAWKRSFVVDALKRIGHIENADDLVMACCPSKEWGVRNKIELEILHTEGGLELGFHTAGSNALLPTFSCPMAEKRMVNAPKALRGALRYLEGSGELGIQRVGVRSSARTGDLEVALWTAPGPFPRKAVGKTLAEALGASSVTRVMIKSSAKARKVVGVEALSGKGFWRERLLDRTMMLSSPSFFQVNTAGAEKLVQLALAYLDLSAEDRVADLYCGAGTFTLPLAALDCNVVGIEMEGSSIRDLRRNLEANNLCAEVIGGDVAREFPAYPTVDAVVVDPPRSGLSTEALDAICSNGPKKIAYVSCNPTTLARDISRLCQDCYSLQSATPVDLFPQTFHVETVALLTRA